MRSEPEATSTVRSWLEHGSTSVPDRVLDAVWSELSSTPQRRPVWSLGRSLRVNTYLKLGALTAVVLVAVAAGVVLLPRGSNVGTPAASPAASPGPVSFTLGGDVIDLTLDASTNDSTLSGSANVSYGDFQEVPELEDQFTISIVCGRMFDASTWILAGEVDKSTHVGLRVGTRAAVFVRNSSPQEVGFWIEEPPLAADCPSFVGAIPDDAIDQPGALAPVSQGQLSLPAIPDVAPR